MERKGDRMMRMIVQEGWEEVREIEKGRKRIKREG
jgi:hypothetical protein